MSNELNPEPVPTPDSADDATVDRDYVAKMLHGMGRSEAAEAIRTATPPADDANRAPVSGVVDEGEREALWNTIALVRDGAPRTTDDADTDDIIDAILDSGWVHNLVASRLRADRATRDAAWVERLAAVEGERDHWKAHAEEAGRGFERVCLDYARVSAARRTAEAERDTARREAGERIAQAIEAGRTSRPTGVSPTEHAARIARADALTSDDGSGA